MKPIKGLGGVVVGENKPIRITMLGGCSLTHNGSTIDGKNVRSKRIWTLLEYLICYRFRCVSQDELIDLLYAEDRDGAPSGALKTLIHRAREALGRLGYADGKELILKCAGGYRWNPDIPLEIDTERFENLIREASLLEKDKDGQLGRRLEALELYKGDFLPEAATDLWAMSIATYFHFQYMSLVHEVLTELIEQNRFDEVVSVAGRAITLDPYDESLYYNLILALANTNRTQAARTQYESMMKLFYGEFGVAPSKELQALYKKLVKSESGVEKDLSVVSADLCQAQVEGGAFFCEYEFFRDFFRLEQANAARKGGSIHICLVSAESKQERELTPKAQNTVVGRLCRCLRQNLRAGDVFSRFSVSQFIVLLPATSQADCEKAIERVIRQYRRDNPRSPASVTYSLKAVEAVSAAIK